MQYYLSKKKIMFMLSCFVLAIISTVLFAAGIYTEEDIKHIKADVLNTSQIKTPQTESFYKEMLDIESNDFFIIDTNSTVIYSTDKWRENHGYTKDEVTKTNYFNYIHPKDLPYFLNALINFLENKETIYNIGPFRMTTKNESYTLFTADIKPIFDEHQHMSLLGVILHDVSVPVGE